MIKGSEKQCTNCVSVIKKTHFNNEGSLTWHVVSFQVGIGISTGLCCASMIASLFPCFSRF